jgi:uncharacterized peroxidase-related enzyme
MSKIAFLSIGVSNQCFFLNQEVRMPRIPAVDPATANGPAKVLLDGAQAQLGMVPNMMRTMANQPAALDAYLKIWGALAQGSFDAPTREAIALAVSGANASGYCASAHTAFSKNLQVDPAEIEARLAGSTADPKLQAALTFTRAVVVKRGQVSDADLAAFRQAGYDDAAIVEIVANVAGNIMANYLDHIANVDIDFPVVTV